MPSFQDKNINLHRISIFIIVLLASFVSSYYIPLENIIDSDFLMIPLTIFPVLFGFCLTVITISGSLDAAMSVLDWKDLAHYQNTFKNKLIRLISLALSYGVIIILALVLRLEPFCYKSFWQISFAKIMIWVSFIALFYSFFMPCWLYNLYCERYEILSRAKGAPQV